MQILNIFFKVGLLNLCLVSIFFIATFFLTEEDYIVPKTNTVSIRVPSAEKSVAKWASYTVEFVCEKRKTVA